MTAGKNRVRLALEQLEDRSLTGTCHSQGSGTLFLAHP